MGALDNAAALAEDTKFAARCVAALVHTARQKIVTADESPLSLSLAQSILRDPEPYRRSLPWIVATDPTVAEAGAEYDEGDVLNAVAAAWPYIARLYDVPIA